MFSRLELYRCTRPLFDEVQEGTVVVVARGYGQGPGVVLRRGFGTRTELIRGLSRRGRHNGRKCPVANELGGGTRLTFHSIGKIGLGGVTGDSDFFLMNEGERASLQIPTGAMTPVVSKARHLKSGALTDAEWADLKVAGERVWLFNPPVALSGDANVRRYLELEPSEGGCNRQAYKVSRRHPWYRTPMPPVADAFLSGMSQHGPWLCINETNYVNATNTLYVVRFLSRNRADWYTCALAFLSSEARRHVRRIGRRYPDGLIKYEPGPIGGVVLPRLKQDADHRDLYLKAVAALLEGQPALSRDIADSALA
jgi:hypothetical protein